MADPYNTLFAAGVSQDEYSASASCPSRTSLAMRFPACTLKPQGVRFISEIYLMPAGIIVVPICRHDKSIPPLAQQKGACDGTQYSFYPDLYRASGSFNCWHLNSNQAQTFEFCCGDLLNHYRYLEITSLIAGDISSDMF